MTQEETLLQHQLIINKLLKLSLHNDNLENFLYKALEIIIKCPWLPVDPKGGIFLTDKIDHQQLNLVTTINFATPLISLCSSIPFGHCLCGKAAQEKKTIFVNDLDHQHVIHYKGMKPHGHYTVPIMDSRKRVLGVIVLYVAAQHIETEDEKNFLEDVANTLAGVLLRREQEERMAELQQKEALVALVSTYNHELNNPLTIAQGMANKIAKDNPKSSEVKKLFTSLERIQEIVKRIDRLPYEKVYFKSYTKSINHLLTLPQINKQQFSDYTGSLDKIAIISATDPSGIITYVNDTFCRFYGYQKDELIGVNHRIVNSGYHSKDFFHSFWKTINAGKIWSGNIKNKKKDGTYYWASTTVTPIIDKKGDISGFLAIKYDNTEEKMKEEKELALQQIKQMNQVVKNHTFCELIDTDEQYSPITIDKILKDHCSIKAEQIINLEENTTHTVQVKEKLFTLSLQKIFETIGQMFDQLKKDKEELQVKLMPINMQYIMLIETPLPKLNKSERRDLLEEIGIVELSKLKVNGLAISRLIMKSLGGDISFNDIKDSCVLVVQIPKN